MSSPNQADSLLTEHQVPGLAGAEMGQENRKQSFLDDLVDRVRGIFRRNPEEGSDLDRADKGLERQYAEPPRQALAVDSPLQNHPPVEERVNAELVTVPQTGNVHGFIPGRYSRSYASYEAGNPNTLESVIVLAESVMEQLKQHPGVTVTINITGLASFEGIKEKNDVLAEKRASMIERILRDQFRIFEVDQSKVSFVLFSRTAGKTEEQDAAIKKLCEARNTSEQQLIRDYNNGAHGFTGTEVALLDEILARNRGANVFARLNDKQAA